jgi:CBS domain containing-hemolysin-like protein
MLIYILDFALIIVLVALNGFFVSVEFAIIASKRSRIDILAEKGNASAQIVRAWLERPATRDRLIAASQLGITIVSLALGAVGENTFERLLEPYFHELGLPPYLQGLTPIIAVLPLVLSLLIVTSLHVIFGEQVPKVATLHNPERFALLTARPMRIFSLLFKWFVDILDWATRQVLALFGLKMVGEHALAYTLEELKHILTMSEDVGVIQSPEKEMLTAIFDLGDLVVRQVMMPRTEIIGVEADTPLEDLVKLATETNFTKFPVYEDTWDQIIGIVHVNDMLEAMQKSTETGCTARRLSREPIYVPETISVSSLLQQFRIARQHIAIVLDEYGGTAGLVTLEDLLEEIVGEVSDPFDPSTPEIQVLPDGTMLVGGLALTDDVNQELGTKLFDPHYDTIAGYMLGKLGRIPRLHDEIESDSVRLRVEAMDGMRIDRLSLVLLPVETIPEPTSKS